MSAAIPYSTTGIYAITNTINSATYIGSAAKSIRERWQNHKTELRKGIHKNMYLSRAWNKYGEGAFTFTVIEVVSDVSTILAREQHWLDQYYPLGPERCYNLVPRAGSNQGWKPRPETIERRAIKLRGQKRTDEQRRRMSEAGKSRPPVSEETRQKISFAGTGRRYTRENGTRTHDGFVAPDGTEYREVKNLYQFCIMHGLDSSTMAKLGQVNHLSANGWTRIGSKGRTRFAFVSPDGARYENITNLCAFCREHGIGFQAMSAVFYGKRPHHKGWIKG